MNTVGLSLADKLEVIIRDFGILLPEGILALGGFILLIAQLVRPKENSFLKTILSLLVLLAVGWVNISSQPDVYFGGLYILTPAILLVKYLFLIITAVVLLYPGEDRLLGRGEYHFLLLMILLGAMLLIQVQNFLLFYLSLELISITSYVLITFDFQRKSFEAGIKYLLFGAVASGLMLYGISLIYGMTGSLSFVDLAMLLSSENEIGLWLSVALGLFFVGVLFKLAMVPMHIWAPDAYEAGPTPIVAYISIVPKIAVLFFLESFVRSTSLSLSDFDWKTIFSGLAVISMFVGNLSALSQKNAKRMMAYSSIAHSGMLIVGIIVGGDFGLQSMLFYAVIYAFMNLGVFYFIGLMNKNGIENMKDLAGMGKRHPLLGVVITVFMISLIGLPPTGGFTAKLLVFSSLWEFYSSQGDSYLLWLFIAGLINAAISLFYYLKIPYFMFVHSEESKMELKYSRKDSTILAILMFIILLSFFKADLLLNVLNRFSFAL